jgi:hypothetical protein
LHLSFRDGTAAGQKARTAPAIKGSRAELLLAAWWVCMVMMQRGFVYINLAKHPLKKNAVAANNGVEIFDGISVVTRNASNLGGRETSFFRNHKRLGH